MEVPYDPENYHMEFVASNEEFAESLMNLINSLGFNSKIVCRKLICCIFEGK